MELQFCKMHGAGNDYVYVHGFKHPLPQNPEKLAPQLSDRHQGIGGDGLILICPPPDDLSSLPADVEVVAQMRMFNADGSESEMCGNGLRCVAKLLSDEGHVVGDAMHILTGAGVLRAEVHKRHGAVEAVRIEMGVPELRASKIPTLLASHAQTERVISAELEVAQRRIPVTCVSMGNPHCVVYLDDLGIGSTDIFDNERVSTLVHELGPLIESHSMFPARVNVEFVAIESQDLVRQRTWERGSGETMACGTGASAVCVAGALTARTAQRLTCELLGGRLEIEWPGEGAEVTLTGPAVKVFDGVVELSKP